MAEQFVRDELERMYAHVEIVDSDEEAVEEAAQPEKVRLLSAFS